MEAALRRRLDGVIDVAISQGAQTAAVVFAPTAHFSPHEFRAAAAEADVEVVSLAIDACGTLQRSEEGWWFTAARDRWPVRHPPPATAEGTLCLTGALVEDGGTWSLQRIVPLAAGR